MKVSIHSTSGQDRFLRRTFCFLFIIALLVITAHRLPAPIQEVPESPTPAATITPTANPKAEANESAASSPSSTPIKFAGTWKGTIPAFPTGPQETVLTIDRKETTMLHTWTGHPPSEVAKAKIDGDTIRATFGNGATSYSFAVTPMPDGVTASVHMQAIMNDFTAVFRRTAEPKTGKPPR